MAEIVTPDELRTLSDRELVALIVQRSSLDEERAREALALLRGNGGCLVATAAKT
jgi:hypothetical protein